MSLLVLRKRSEFLSVASSGKKWVASSVIVQMGLPQKTSDSSLIRYGLTASGKIGNAVIRNRARRRLRALAIELLPLYAKKGCDYVLIARATTATRDFPELKKDFTTALKKLAGMA